MTRSQSPFRYPGGKATLGPLVAEIIRHNNLWLCDYAEPFAGGAGLALRLMFENVVWNIHINDKDPAIWGFWHAALNENAELVRLILETPVTVDEWRRQREILLAADLRRPAELGFAAFFLNRTNRSGVIKSGGIIGGFDQVGPYKIDCRFNRRELASRVARLRHYRKRIHLTHLDAAEFLAQFQRNATRPSLLCIDPPYYNQGSSLYSNYYQRGDHAALAQQIQALHLPWLLTYDRATAIAELYGERKRYAFDIAYSVNRKRKGSELMVLSDRLEVPATTSRPLEPLDAAA
jgi:DNA adenine methylase